MLHDNSPDQPELFCSPSQKTEQAGPLAFKFRPQSFEKYAGFSKLLKKHPFLTGQHLPSLIIWGPSGCGKTTLAHILAKTHGRQLLPFNAVLAGVAELRKLIKVATQYESPIIFIDEIHRFNKAQQDALLPHVETGDFVLIGATTENPKVSINKALLSRSQTIEIPSLSKEDLIFVINNALESLKWSLDQEVIDTIAMLGGHDARKALNIIETLHNEKHESINIEEIKDRFLDNARIYDKSDDRHYDVISAFIKSMRGSDPDNALLWLAVMIDGGEDPIFIARRCVIFASEDIGNADPRALTLATSAMEAISKIGMPEARIILGQTVTYLASTVKSNAAYTAIDAALEYVRNQNTIEVPTHLRNQHPDKKNYLYPHSYKDSFVTQKYGPDHHKFYQPKDIGQEVFLKERLQNLWKSR